MSLALFPETADAVFRQALQLEDPIGNLVERFAGFGQRQLFPGAFDQADVIKFLKAFDRLGDGRLGDVRGVLAPPRGPLRHHVRAGRRP